MQPSSARRTLLAPPVLLLFAALAAAAALLLYLSRDLTYYQDTWSFLLNRRELTADALFAPHNEHISVAPVAIQALLVSLFGMDSARPDFVLLIVAVLATATLVFVYVRRRIGAWPALIAAVLLLFYGAAWQDLLWPFELSFVGSLFFGVAMLLALDRADRLGDAIACGCLIASIAFSSLGLPFVIAAAVDVWVRRGTGGLRRAYVFVVPALLYAGWWLEWGHEAPRRITVSNLLSAPQYVLEGFASVFESLLGLTSSSAETATAPTWGTAICVLVVALAVHAWSRGRLPRPSPAFWPAAAATIANWFLASLNFIPGREPYQSRYLLAGGVFVVLCAAELLRGAAIARRALLAAGVVCVFAIGSGFALLRAGSLEFEEQSVLTRADLGAIEIAADTVSPTFVLTPEIAGTPSLIDVRADLYLEAVAEEGSPAYTPAELLEAPEAGRQQADVVLFHALPITTRAATDAQPLSGDCVVAGGAEPTEVELAGELTEIRVDPGADARLRLRRFAGESYPVTLPSAPAGLTTGIRIPRDTVDLPWRLQVDAAQRVEVCSAP